MVRPFLLWAALPNGGYCRSFAGDFLSLMVPIALAIFKENASVAKLEFGTLEEFVYVLGVPMVVECRVVVGEVTVPLPGLVVRFFLVFLVFFEVVREDFEDAVEFVERV